jgi:serine protease Do
MTLRRAAFLAGAFLAAVGGFPGRTMALPADEEARIALVARTARSVVQILGETDRPPITPSAGKGGPASSRPARNKPPTAAIDDFFRSINESQPPRREAGTGFVVDEQNGLVLTAAHLVGKLDTIRVGLPDGTSKAATLVGIDEDSGIALLRVAGLGLPALPLESRIARPGETALLVGWMNPLNAVLPIEGMVMGPVPALSDEPAAPPLGDYVALTNVLPNGGFGGSPVLGRDGRVIGIVSAIYGRTYGPGALTMMIATSSIANVVDQLGRTGSVRRSEIGIQSDCSADPCKIADVTRGGPAEAAGIRADDAAIAVDGVAIRTDAQLRRAIAAKPVGSTVAMTIARGGQQSTVHVVTRLRSPRPN